MIIAHLAENGPENMYQIAEKTNIGYSSVHKAIKTLNLTGIAQPEGESVSKTNVKTTSYGLTFKGVLKYLATFNIEKMSKKQEKDLLNILEKQGENLNYAPFREIRWLREHIPNLTSILVSEANYVLRQPLSGFSKLADGLSRRLSDPNFPLGKDDLFSLRSYENLDLRDAFGRSLLLCIRVKGENQKLRQYAQILLNDERKKLSQLEQAFFNHS